MKAVATNKDGVIHIAEVPIPHYGEYECLVRIRACGICNSTDRKLITNTMGDFPVQYPALLGHEAVGEIAAVGSKVRNFKVGDRVVSPCGRLEPGTVYHSAWAAMAEYGIAHDIKAMLDDGLAIPDDVEAHTLEDYPVRSVPEGMSWPDAVMLLTIKENYSALLNFGMTAGKDVFIFGDGPVAYGLSCLARAMGAGFIGVAGHHEERLANIVRDARVDIAVNSHQIPVEEALHGRSFDIVVDAVGSTSIIKQGARFLKPGGRVGVYGVLSRPGAEINLLDLPNNVCIQMLNRPYGEYRAHDAVCRLVAEGKIDPTSFYSHVIPIDEAARGFEMVKSREALKVILTM